jgi:hypothetical protein
VRYANVDLVDAFGRPASAIAPGDTLVVRARYQAEHPVSRPVFQIGVVDVDTGTVVTTATSSPSDVPETVSGTGVIECRFDRMPLRPRQYVLRLIITDDHRLASYDVVTAGPRFAVTGHGRGVDGLSGVGAGEDEDGLVSLAFQFAHRSSAVEAGRS